MHAYNGAVWVRSHACKYPAIVRASLACFIVRASLACFTMRAPLSASLHAREPALNPLSFSMMIIATLHRQTVGPCVCVCVCVFQSALQSTQTGDCVCVCECVCGRACAGSANDGCPAVEPVVLYNLQDSQFLPMAQYYLTPNSGGLTLPQALKQSNLVDITLITDTVRDLTLVHVYAREKCVRVPHSVHVNASGTATQTVL